MDVLVDALVDKINVGIETKRMITIDGSEGEGGGPVNVLLISRGGRTEDVQ